MTTQVTLALKAAAGEVIGALRRAWGSWKEAGCIAYSRS